MWLDFGTPETINFLFGTNGKFNTSGVQIPKYITVCICITKADCHTENNLCMKIFAFMKWK